MCIGIALQKFDEPANIDDFLLLLTHLRLHLIESFSKSLNLEAASGDTLELDLEKAHVGVFIRCLLQVLLCIPHCCLVTVRGIALVSSQW